MKKVTRNAKEKARAKKRAGFPSRLTQAREAAGLTQQDLALAVGVHPTTAGHWEGGRFPPSVENTAKLAARLGVRFAWLAVGDGEMRDEPTGG